MAGDAMITVALAGSLFFSISPTAARGRVTLSLILTMAPFAIVAPFLGPAIDRARRGRRAMVFGSCAGRAATCLVMAGVLDSLLLFPAAFTILVLSKAYSVAKSSLVPSAVTSNAELVEANSKLSITGVVFGFLAAGPAVGLLHLFGGEWTLRLAAVVFVVGAVLSLRVVERREPAPERQEAAAAAEELAQPGVIAAATAMALLRAVVGFLTFLVAFAFRREGVASWWFGVVLAASMGASLLGAAVAPRVRGVVREEHMLAGTLAVAGVAGLVLSRLDGRIWAAVMAAAVGVAASAGKLSFDAIVQRDAPDAIRGRSFARFEAGFQLVWVIGALMPVVISTPLFVGYAAIGIGCSAASVAYVVAGHRSGTPVAKPAGRD